MTLKYEDLEKFAEDLRKKYIGLETLPATILDEEIMKRFGLSNYIINNIKKSLGVTRIMTPIDPFKWRLKNGDMAEESK